MLCTGSTLLGQSPSAFLLLLLRRLPFELQIELILLLKSFIKVLHVFLEDLLGVEPTRCVMVIYWGALMYPLREFIKNYNVVQLAPSGQEFLPVLGATPLGSAFESAQAERAKFFSLDFLRTRFPPGPADQRPSGSRCVQTGEGSSLV